MFANASSTVLAGQAQLVDLTADEAVHGLGAADEHAVGLLGILADDVGGDEAVLEALLLLVGEDVDHLHLVAGGADGVQLFTEEDVLLGAAAEDDGQVEVLDAVPDGVGHGQEGGDAAAAGQSDDVLGVTQILVVELALAAGGDHGVAHLQVLQHPVGSEAAGIGAHGDGHLALQRPLGRGADGVGAGDKALADLQLQRQILTGPEIGQRLALGRVENKGLGPGAGVVDDLTDHQLLVVGVQQLCVVVDGEIALDLLGGSGLNGLLTDLGHVLELQHIQNADETYLNIQCHYWFPPSSLRSFRASRAISWPQR